MYDFFDGRYESRYTSKNLKVLSFRRRPKLTLKISFLFKFIDQYQMYDFSDGKHDTGNTNFQ